MQRYSSMHSSAKQHHLIEQHSLGVLLAIVLELLMEQRKKKKATLRCPLVPSCVMKLLIPYVCHRLQIHVLQSILCETPPTF